jgi:hypothetical protein
LNARDEKGMYNHVAIDANNEIKPWLQEYVCIQVSQDLEAKCIFRSALIRTVRVKPRNESVQCVEHCGYISVWSTRDDDFVSCAVLNHYLGGFLIVKHPKAPLTDKCGWYVEYHSCEHKPDSGSTA